jgi:ferredoxin
MANQALRLPTNAPGPVFVDRMCIDCGACRRLAPSVFDAAGGRSYVRHEPCAEEETIQTLQDRAA